ncbi:hypothetical protein PIB30_056873 [Stylosanthes scabra]|uniref:Uncharacterized protein n=1 Tax=Stylosanthes scabra TaxID=79078 RepID=A0ABU6VL91_9FABA|nr:hypothetical protein [Stylosanthes scabra]
MAKKLNTALMLCLLALLLLVESNAMTSASTTEAPAPLPSNITGITEGSLQPQECSPRCAERCSNTQYKKPCLFFCNKCCEKCLCVPPGTYGNKQLCPCYNNWKTKRGGPKCP